MVLVERGTWSVLARFTLFCGLALSAFACGANDGGAAGTSAGSGNRAGSGGSANQAGGTAAGSSNANAGTNAGGAASGGSAGSSQSGGSGGSAGAATNAGAGGAAGGAAGSSGGGGSDGMPVACTPGMGTEPVGQSSELDHATCLTWTKTKSAMTLTNKQADAYCANLDQDGISDWRVPAPEELVTWPGLATADTAYITNPIYIPTGSTVMDGCTGNSHSCNIAEYSDNNLTCAWQGVGFAGWVTCVSGTAAAGTTKPAFSAANCAPCNSELATFQQTDCSAYAN